MVALLKQNPMEPVLPEGNALISTVTVNSEGEMEVFKQQQMRALLCNTARWNYLSLGVNRQKGWTSFMHL